MEDELKIEHIEVFDVVIPIWARSLDDLGPQPRLMTRAELLEEYPQSPLPYQKPEGG